MKKVFGIDPGNSGALVLTDGQKMQFWKMPVNKIGTLVEIDFIGVREILHSAETGFHVFLERAVPFAMGTKSAFNYGRGFAAIEIALLDLDIPYTLVEPAKWTKVMHAGIKGDLKPKAKSLVAVKRLFPKLAKEIPTNKNGKMDEGVMDALLIAGFGLQQAPGLPVKPQLSEIEDF